MSGSSTTPSAQRPRWLAPLLVGPASVAAAVALPGLVISAYAPVAGDPERITAFAVAVAEPLALVAALATTGVIAYRTARRAARPARWGAFLGAIAAAGMLGAAMLVNDVDGWTAAAVGLLPIVGLLGARWSKRLASWRDASPAALGAVPDARRVAPASPEAPLPPDQVPEPARAAGKGSPRAR